MPGSVSQSNPGPSSASPYVPEWCYPRGPKMCPCGHHEGFHDDYGRCLHQKRCGCVGLPPSGCTPDEEML